MDAVGQGQRRNVSRLVRGFAESFSGRAPAPETSILLGKQIKLF